VDGEITGRELEGRRTLHVTTVAVTAFCFLRSWFRYLTERGCRVTAATTLNEYADELRATGADLVNIPISRRIAPLADLVSLARLYRLMRDGKFDSVHTHTSKAGFIGRLAARLAGVPLIIHTIHDPPHNSARNILLKIFYIFLERLAGTWAHHIITVSQANLDEISRRRIVSAEKVTVLHEGIRVEEYYAPASPGEIRKKLGIPEGAPVISIIARLEAAKGHRYLLDAAPRVIERFPEVLFVMGGRGRLLASLQRQARELGVEKNVIFTGYLEDIRELLCISTVFVFPSLWEGLGIALLEAMAFRLPVVAAATGGILDVVEDGVTGNLVPPKDSGALADALVRLLGDEDLRESMGRAGFERLSAHFRDEGANRRMYAHYVKLFRERGLIPNAREIRNCEGGSSLFSNS
jgi:glycosyltransferase involved in cell wall biosynthesis